MYHSFNIAVIIPCYNEQKAIAKVINDFKTNIPTASIYVFDNNSTDSTAQVAEDAGATVHCSSERQGECRKTYVLRCRCGYLSNG